MNMLVTYADIDKTRQVDVFELDKTVKLEIKASTLKRLLERRQVCVSDFRCLDFSSKESVKALCLQTCLRWLS